MRCSMAPQAAGGEVKHDKQQEQADGVDPNHVHPAWRAGDGKAQGSGLSIELLCSTRSYLRRQNPNARRSGLRSNFYDSDPSLSSVRFSFAPS
jgi:hypothetical protein